MVEIRDIERTTRQSYHRVKAKVYNNGQDTGKVIIIESAFTISEEELLKQAQKEWESINT
jgi:hypothetical protein